MNWVLIAHSVSFLYKTITSIKFYKIIINMEDFSFTPYGALRAYEERVDYRGS